MEQKEMKLVYEMLLKTPGMEEAVKLDTKLSRRMTLLLVQVIGKGLVKTDQDKGIISVLSDEERKALASLSETFLEKAGLSDLNNNLQQFLR